MRGSISYRERAFRGALGFSLAFVALNVGLVGHGSSEPTVLAWGAAILAVFALATAATGRAWRFARVGLHADWSLAYLAARLFVGWEFLYAGYEKATNGWYTDSAGTAEVKGLLGGAIAQSHATAQNPFPAVAHWFAWTADNVFVPHAQLVSYLVVTGEVLVGVGLILGLCLRASAFFGVTMSALFMFAGALGAGINPEMIIPGVLLVVGIAPAVFAASADRYVLPKLRGTVPRFPSIGRHAAAH
jgi:thiosulfate dehydrogenase [quinone] large subunit